MIWLMLFIGYILGWVQGSEMMYDFKEGNPMWDNIFKNLLYLVITILVILLWEKW